jgi:hypothetical protein
MISRTSSTVRGALAVAVLCVALVAMAAPSFVAAASNPTKAQYHTQAQQPFNGGGGGKGSPPSTTPPSVDTPSTSGLNGNVGPLPFTGFDVLSMAAVALAVSGAGLLLQRAVSRRPHEDADVTKA